jgi:xanthine dehydrogenase YagR molybdenum-binding subunit
MTELLPARAIGQALPRLDGALKVTGRAPYAYEQPVDDPAYLHLVQSTVARGRITAIDTAAALATPGVLAVITHENAPRLASDENKELRVLESPEVAYRGQLIGAVVAETPEIAREAAELVWVSYRDQPHDVELSADRTELYRPAWVNPRHPTDTFDGDVDPALATAEVTLDQTYSTPMEHHNAIETHTTVGVWDEKAQRLLLYDANQGSHTIAGMLAAPLGLEPGQVHVVSPYVGGAFGSKAQPKPHHVAVAMAAQVLGAARSGSRSPASRRSSSPPTARPPSSGSGSAPTPQAG